MSNVLMVNVGSEGHINPTISVVQRLVEQGEHVVYYVSDNFADKLKQTGAEIRPISTEALMTEFRHYGNDNLFNVINGLLRMGNVVIPEVLNGIEGEHYDYLIHDSMFSMDYCIAQHLDIPSISLYASFAENKTTFDQKLDGMAHALSDAEVAKADDIFNDLKQHLEQKYDVDIPSRYVVMQNPADLNITFVMKGFQSNKDLIPDDQFIYAGPSLRHVEQDTEFLENIDSSRPLIYISLGTVFNSNQRFFEQCVEAFSDIDATVLMSISNPDVLDALNDFPDNFIVKSYVPQLEVLKRADLFLTHGGMNSTNEGIYYHVPLIAFPQGADQPFVAKRIAELNIGTQMDTAHISAEDIKKEATHILEHLDTYQANVRKVAEDQPYEEPGYIVAADKIMAFGRQSK